MEVSAFRPILEGLEEANIAARVIILDFFAHGLRAFLSGRHGVIASGVRLWMIMYRGLLNYRQQI